MTGVGVLEEAVALVKARRQADRGVLADRAGDVGLADQRIVVAVSQLGRAAKVERRRLGGNRDHARRGILAEQRRLRPAQDLDPLHVGQVHNLRRCARAIDVVDEHADRRLDAGVVGAVAEAANEEVGLRAALPLADLERRDDRLQVPQVADLALLDRVRGGDGDGDGHILQRLFALGSGDDDLVAAAGALVGRRRISGRTGRLGSLRSVLRCGQRGHRQRYPGRAAQKEATRPGAANVTIAHFTDLHLSPGRDTGRSRARSGQTSKIC